MSFWRQLAESGALSPVDLGFGAACRRWDGGPDAELLAFTGALASFARGRGSSCVSLPERAGRPFAEDLDIPDGPPLPSLPSLEAWREKLRASRLVSDGSRVTPLVLDESDRLYLYRYWRAELDVAAAIHHRIHAPPEAAKPALTALWRKLFGPFRSEPNWQAAAALAALRRRFTIIVGGPGTGKTWTVARLLALLLEAEPKTRVALAAPTGKAAARLSESIRAQTASLPIGDAAKAALPHEAKTLHRLLGFMPAEGAFRRNAWRPLAYDAVVVDEASMIDILLMKALTDALPDRCRLILLGDPDQLASVDTGFALGDMARAARLDTDHGQDFGRAYELAAGFPLPIRPAAPPLRDAAVGLRANRRFGPDSGIGEVSAAIRDMDGDRALGAFDNPRFSDVARVARSAKPTDALGQALACYHACCRAASPEEAWAAFDRIRVLCGPREGPWGVAGLNQAIARHLRDRGVAVDEAFYQGKPILITANDYANRLFNGDIGICGPGPHGPLVYFREGDALRALPASRLPAHETAWAMTVHKTQGSEFARALLILPEAPRPLCCRELFYTGATRARESLTVVASAQDVLHACQTRALRTSGLADRLADAGPTP